MSTHNDITEREQVDARLRQQKEQLDTALENMSQGLCMFDGEQKLVVCNDRYRQIYGLPPELVTPGTMLRQILEHRVANGVHGEDHGQAVQAIVTGSGPSTRRIVALNDGRVIAIEHRLMPEGAWVATHEDITQQRAAQERVRAANQELITQRFAIDQAAIVGLTDVEGRITYANDKFCEISGYTREELLGKDHRILNSGVHPSAYFSALYRCIARGNVWRGEICNKAKDGSVYWVDTTIVPRLDESGKPTAYMAIRIDISAQKAAEEALCESRLHARRAVVQLDAALNNMVQGLAMFDAEQRLVICNRRYAEMYGLTPEQVEPDTTGRQILAYCITNGCYVGRNSDEMLASTIKRLGSRGTGYYTTKLSGGQAYAVSVAPMENGNTVTTHEDITERRRIEAHIAHLAHHDALTDLANRVVLRERLEQALIGTRQNEEGVAVLFLDLDRFKEVNDTLGHPVGDELLKAIADRLRGCVRDSDTLARLGGDEFAIVQIAATQPTDATVLAARIIELLSEPYHLAGHQVVTGASIGIAIAPNDGTDPDQLLKNADLALNRAKSEGRATYRFFEPEMNTRMQARRALELDLRQALANGEFELYYQPIINLERHEVSSFEALLRWNHPERGRISPAEFIPLAEETGLIVPIGEWVLREAVSVAAPSWPQAVGAG